MYRLRLTVGILATFLMLLSSSGIPGQAQDASSASDIPDPALIQEDPNDAPASGTDDAQPAEPGSDPPVDPTNATSSNVDDVVPSGEEPDVPGNPDTDTPPIDPGEPGTPTTGPPVDENADEEIATEDSGSESPIDPADDETAPPAGDIVNTTPPHTQEQPAANEDIESTPEPDESRVIQTRQINLTSGPDPDMMAADEQEETLTVTVLHPDGTPLPSAYVTVRNDDWMLSGEGVTNANGVVVFGYLGGGSGYEVQASAIGGLSGEGRVSRDGANLTLTIQTVARVSENDTIILEALDFDRGEFLRSATFRIYDASGTLLYTVQGDDVDQSTEFTGDFADGYYTVVATADGYDPGYGQFFMPQAEYVTVLLTERPAISYTLTVFDIDDQSPVSGASVEIRSGTGDLLASGTTEGDGAFSRDLLNKGYAYEQYAVSITHPYYLPASQTFTVEDPSRPVRMEVGLEALQTRIIVTDDADNGIPDASITVIPAGGQDAIRGQTDASGAYSLKGLSDGTYNVTVTKEGYGTGNTSFTLPVPGPVMVKLVPESSSDAPFITFVVYDAGTGKPIEGATLIARGRQGVFVTQGITGDDGSWTTRNDGQAIAVYVYVDGYVTGSTSFPAPDSGVESQAIHLRQLVTGVVIDDSTGEPIPNITVQIWDYTTHGYWSTTTGEDGRFSFRFTEYPHGQTFQFRVNWYWRDTSGELKPEVLTEYMDGTFPIGMTGAPVELRISPSVEGSGSQNNRATMTTNLTLCANEDCSVLNTGADGATATWKIRSASAAFIPDLAMASTGHGPAPARLLAQAEPPSYAITAIVTGGSANGSISLPVGHYTVCLSPVLSHPDGSTFQIADKDMCAIVQLTPDGVLGEPLQFGVLVPLAQGDPTESPTQRDDSPAKNNDEKNTAGSPSSPEREPGNASTGVTTLPVTGAGTSTGIAGHWLLLASAFGLAAVALGARRRSRV